MRETIGKSITAALIAVMLCSGAAVAAIPTVKKLALFFSGGKIMPGVEVLTDIDTNNVTDIDLNNVDTL